MDRRNTKQRSIILEAVQSRCDHPGAEQIFRQVKEQDPKISLGTVYRNLAVLEEEGKILSITLPGADRFDLNTKPHNHFLCEKCGGLFDIDIDYYSATDNTCTKDGFTVRTHQTVFRGICPKCAKEKY